MDEIFVLGDWFSHKKKLKANPEISYDSFMSKNEKPEALLYML